MDNSDKKKKIAKNTLALYIRMLFNMVVSLYMSRVILDVLGVSDFGIYTVVGGVVFLFTFISGSMAGATQRFFAFELGRGNKIRLRKVLNSSIIIHVLLALSILVLAETIGFWLFAKYINIPHERMQAASCVYHFSVVTFFVTIISVPYKALIIAHEDMGVFALIGVVETVLKLAIVYLLLYITWDKLVVYAALVLLVAFLIGVMQFVYCRSKYGECRFELYYNRLLYSRLLSFSGWQIFGNLAFVLSSQGINVLLNLFFGPIINSARGIAFQVDGAINSFVTNFQMAVNPQLIKSYASNEKSYMAELLIYSSKYSFFLLFLLSLPVLLESDFILALWLKEVPPYSSVFLRLVILNSLIGSLSGSLMTVASATGRIKWYQIIVGGLLLLNLPESYILLKFGYPVYVPFVVVIINSCMALFCRVELLHRMVGMSRRDFSVKVLLAVLLTGVGAAIFPFFVRLSMEEGWVRFLSVLGISILSTCLAVYFVGLRQSERNVIKNKIRVFVVGLLNK